jgi:hypothetical protein
MRFENAHLAIHYLRETVVSAGLAMFEYWNILMTTSCISLHRWFEDAIHPGKTRIGMPLTWRLFFL